jgi:DNA-binding NtrC family response regulator
MPRILDDVRRCLTFGFMTPTVLIVDDDERICVSLSEVVTRQGLTVDVAGSAEAALARLTGIGPDIVLTDVRMPGLSGLQRLGTLKERTPGIDVVPMSAFEDLPTVAAAMRDGAVDFLVKPLDPHPVREVMTRVLEDRAQRDSRAADRPGQEPEADDGSAADANAPRLVGRDPAMIDVFKKVGQAAANRAPVLIRGGAARVRNS